jgi:Flp pilus assembly protein CpaB
MEAHMNRRTQLILGFVALILALGAGYGVYTYFDRLTTTATVPVPQVPIPAGALISPELLQEREVPRTLLKEPIYTALEELVGQVAQIPLQPGLVVYRAHAVPPQDYRLVSDPALSVVSVPVDPARAVGGQVQPGHTVDIWALPELGADAGPTATLTATLVLQDAPVVDVRTSQGQAVARQAQAIPGQYTAGDEQQPRTGQQAPLQILTVALPVTETETLLGWLTAEENGRAVLWTALAPLVRPEPRQQTMPNATYSTQEHEVDTKTTSTPASTATLTPRPTATPLPTPTPPLPTPTPPPSTWVITGTEGLALRVRDKPATGAEIGTLPEGTRVASNPAGTWIISDTTWYYITALTNTEPISGWVSGEYLVETGE